MAATRVLLAPAPGAVSPSLRAYGPGGRSSVSGVVATLFGATGFLGRYVCNQLGRVGSTVFPTWRGDELDYRHLRLMGDLGQINPVEIELRNAESVRRALAGSNVVINLAGKFYDTRYYSLEDVHVRGAQAIARMAAEEGVGHLIHVSAAAARADTRDRWARSKALGEQAVRAEFPSATVLRPCDMWGTEDRFLTRVAAAVQRLPFLPLVDGGRHVVQPVWVDDVATAVSMCVRDPELTAGKTYVLGGPERMSMQDVVQFVCESTKRSATTVTVPALLAEMLARAAGKRLPFVNPSPAYNEWDVLREASDDAVVASSDGAANAAVAAEDGAPLQFADLDVVPHALRSELGRDTLRQFRRGGDRSSLFFVD